MRPLFVKFHSEFCGTAFKGITIPLLQPPSTPIPLSVDRNLLLLDRQIRQKGSGSGDPLRATVVY